MQTCEQYLQILNQIVEERATLPTDLQNHLAECSSRECQEALIEFELLNFAINSWKANTPVANLTPHVLTKYSQDADASAPSVESPRVLNRPQEQPKSPMAVLIAVCTALSLCIIGIIQSTVSSNHTSVAIQQSTNSQNHLTDVAEKAEAEAELREFGIAYGNWMQGVNHKLTSTVSVVLLEDQKQNENAESWFSELTEQIEQPFESTLKFLIEESNTSKDEQTLFDKKYQNEYFGFLLSKSESLKPLFTLISV